VQRYNGNRKVKSITLLDQFLSMAFAQSLIKIARPLYAKEDLGLDLDNTVYALDASTIDVYLSVFPWAKFRTTKGDVTSNSMSSSTMTGCFPHSWRSQMARPMTLALLGLYSY
jgi:hypothetical protein